MRDKMCRGDLFESGDRMLPVTARPALLFSSDADRSPNSRPGAQRPMRRPSRCGIIQHVIVETLSD
jgi:hypothetical protein